MTEKTKTANKAKDTDQAEPQPFVRPKSDPKRGAPALLESRMQLAEYNFNIWSADPTEGTTLKDMLAPSYWAHASRRLKPRDKIIVWEETGAFYAELLVIDAGANWAKVEQLEYKELHDRADSREVKIDNHVVKWNGPFDLWVVIRDSDRAKLVNKQPSRKAAITWLEDHVRTMAA